MPFMEGTITIVQESRFQMTDDRGASHLFSLSPHAAADPSQLAPLAAQQSRIRVKFREGDNIIGAIAQSISVMTGGEAR
ncbi:hypothetical protein P7D22_03355 [Lichenihabitans sp. Uapishka_5]|uniref:hypothetical protein n=1 Tax=Lichenihabitans sp. Uapishka_5 TaxID=3037302 RepID=UPI0029E80C44|nr:hypothetical protein [Lichenihabitans sp. Uapishka_5]MDX7950215.1 hypothetical protein [Lichenihabitans sp. Uapishka_5]